MNGDESLMRINGTRRKPWIVLALAAIMIALLFFAVVSRLLMGSGGWEHDEHSDYAARARAVDSELHNGMTRTEVKKIFHDDVLAFPRDSVEDSSDAYWGEGMRKWAIETDFSIFEPRHLGDTFDTMWTIRTRFNQENGVLIEHDLRPIQCCGP